MTMTKTQPVNHTVDEIAIGNMFDTLERQAWAVMDFATFALATEGPLPIYHTWEDAVAYNRAHYQGRGRVVRVRIVPEPI